MSHGSCLIFKSILKLDFTLMLNIAFYTLGTYQEIVYPTITSLKHNSNHKTKRSILGQTAHALNVKLKALQKHFNLNLLPNHKLLSSNFNVETLNGLAQTVEKRALEKYCYYVGKMENENDSLVSMDTCDGGLVCC